MKDPWQLFFPTCTLAPIYTVWAVELLSIFSAHSLNKWYQLNAFFFSFPIKTKKMIVDCFMSSNLMQYTCLCILKFSVRFGWTKY